MFSEILAVTLPTFFMAFVGYAWVLMKQEFPVNFVAKLVTLVGTPFLIFSTLAHSGLSVSALTTMMLASVMLAVASGLIAFLGLKSVGWDPKSFVTAFVIGNGGNLGLPVTLFAFGEEGLALGIAFFVVQSFLFFTVGNYLYAGTNIGAALKLPTPYAALAGITVVLLGWQMPIPLANTVNLAGSLVIPLMLITLGVSIARLRLVELWPSLLFAVARLIVMFVVAKLIIWGLDLDGIMAGVIILQACMPAAVFNFLFATLYKREADRVAGIVLVSSLMMIIVLPLLVAYVKAG